MNGPNLHRYDVRLCEYVLGNICQYLDRKQVRDRVGHLRSEQLRDYLVKHHDYNTKWSDADDAKPPALLFNSQELETLELAFEGMQGAFEWTASRPLHEAYVDTLPEIRKRLSTQNAEDWARRCGEIGWELEGRKLELFDGIGLVNDWLRALRRLKRNIGDSDQLPCPDGSQATPTRAAAAPPKTPESATMKAPDPEDVKKVREAIQGKGKNAKSDAIVMIAGVRREDALAILRLLEDQGEYKGFFRRPRRPRSSPQ